MLPKAIVASLLSFCCVMSSSAQQGVIILENGLYFNGKEFVPFKEIVVKGDKITAINNTPGKDEGQRIKLNGKYVIPGLVDAHVHIGGSPAMPYVMAEPTDNLKSALHCGVTTVIDLFYSEQRVKALKADAEKSPEFFSTPVMAGPILTAPGGHGTEYGVPTRTITSVDEARRITNEVIDNNMDVIKVAYEAYSNKNALNKEELKEIITVAHKRNKKVFVHINVAAEAADCADAGADVLAHMPVDSLTDDQLNRIKRSGAMIIPTVTVYQSLLEGHTAAYMSDSLLWRTANPQYLEHFSREALPKVPMQPKYASIFSSVKYRENLQNCYHKKIPIIAGTDAGNYAVFYGYSLHNEIAQYVKEGMTNADALCAATENITRVLPNLKIGKIQEGFDADLVILATNPLTDIAATKDIKMVCHKGKMVDLPGTLFETKPVKALEFDPSALKFEDMKELPPYIFPISDSTMGGNSRIAIRLQKEPGGNGYLQMTGKIVRVGFRGFGGVLFILGKEEHKFEPYDLSAYKAIEFDVRGNDETYYTQLCSSQVHDYNYHTASFTVTKEWKTVKIPFDFFKQNPYYGKQMSLDAKTISAIAFEAINKDYVVDLSVKNIHFLK